MAHQQDLRQDVCAALALELRCLFLRCAGHKVEAEQRPHWQLHVDLPTPQDEKVKAPRVSDDMTISSSNESAGYDQERVSLQQAKAPVVKEGTLTKRAVGSVGVTWHKRWIVLRADLIEWYREQGDASATSIAKGQLKLTATTVVRPESSLYKQLHLRPMYGLVIDTGDRKLSLDAKSASECLVWMNAVSDAVRLLASPKEPPATPFGGVDLRDLETLHPVAKSEERAGATCVPREELHVASLLVKHAAALGELLANVETLPDFDPKHTSFDELGRLRFLLSAKLNVARAAKDIRTAMAQRKRYKLDEIAEEVRNKPIREWKVWPVMGPYTARTLKIIQPDPDGPVIILVRVNIYDQHATIKDGVLQDYLELWHCITEAVHQKIDETTRRTGYITKSVKLINFDGFKMSQLSRQWLISDTNHTNEMMSIYPQSSTGIVGVNTPRALKSMYDKVIKLLLPKSVTEKVALVGDVSTASPKELAESLSRHNVSLDDVPSWWGGMNQGVVPNFVCAHPEVEAASELAFRQQIAPDLIFREGRSNQQVNQEVFDAVTAACAAREAEVSMRPSDCSLPPARARSPLARETPL